MQYVVPGLAASHGFVQQDLQARRAAVEAKMVPESQGVEAEAGLAYALADAISQAESLADDLAKRFPLDTQVQSLWLPTIRAQLALDRKNPQVALNEIARAAPPTEFGAIAYAVNTSCFILPMFVDRRTWRRRGTEKLMPSSRQSSIMGASSGTSGPDRLLSGNRAIERLAREDLTRCRR